MIKSNTIPLIAIPAIIHLDSALVRSHRSDGRRNFQFWIKPATAHNDKMGVNWSVVRKTYEPKPNPTRHFSVSQY